MVKDLAPALSSVGMGRMPLARFTALSRACVIPSVEKQTWKHKNL